MFVLPRSLSGSHIFSSFLLEVEPSMPALLHRDINDADILIGFVSFGIDFDI